VSFDQLPLHVIVERRPFFEREMLRTGGVDGRARHVRTVPRTAARKK
jgi:hypothetical protein